MFVMGRTDDVINVAGHRLSTGAIEAVLAGHPAVAECAVIGVADPMKGQVPRGFVVLKAGVDEDEDELRAELVAAVRDQIGPVASFKDVAVVAGAAQDPLGEDPAQDHARDRRRAGRPDALHHRGRLGGRQAPAHARQGVGLIAGGGAGASGRRSAAPSPWPVRTAAG